MTYGKCVACKQVRKLVVGKLCILCVESIKKAFSYSIDGKQVSKQNYNVITKRGYCIPEELEAIRNEKI